MQLNLLSGRSYRSLSQYPVFPWVLCDYSSAELDLRNPAVFRDLAKPVGALNAERLQSFEERFQSLRELGEEAGDLPPFLYGTHYSTPGYVLHYLVRVEPFALFHIDLQSGSFDEYPRLFNSVEAAWRSSLESATDVKELTPEWFCLPAFLTNASHFPLNDREVRLEAASHAASSALRRAAAALGAQLARALHRAAPRRAGERSRQPASARVDRPDLGVSVARAVNAESTRKAKAPSRITTSSSA